MIRAYCCYDNDLCGVINMFDELGDETDNIEEVYSIVFQRSDGTWMALETEPSLLLRPN